MKWLLEGEPTFIPRTHCGIWETWLIQASIIANLIFGVAYFAIPISLMIIWIYKKHELRWAKLLVLYAIFILFCGITHFCHAAAFKWPMYRLFTMIEVIGSLFSIFVAIYMPFTIIYLIKLPTKERVLALLDELQIERFKNTALIKNEQYKNKKLENEIMILKDMLTQNVWATEQNIILKKLQDVLSTIGVKNGS